MSNPYTNPYQWQDPSLQYEGTPRPTRHSGFGLASLVIGIAVALLEGACIVLAAIAVERGDTEQSPTLIIAGCSILVGLVVALAGVGLGIGSLFQRDRKRILGIIGITINALVLLGTGGLMLIGILAS